MASEAQTRCLQLIERVCYGSKFLEDELHRSLENLLEEVTDLEADISELKTELIKRGWRGL